MASLRKASSYSKKTVRPYTRKSSKRKKSYIKAVPQNKIVKFNMGKGKAEDMKKYKFIIQLLSEEKVQVRDNALESCRMLINKSMEREVPGTFCFRVKVFPHHILRENKTAAGAGADRLSSGMKHSFGITAGRAAIVNPGKDLFEILCITEKGVQAAKRAMKKVKPKIPCKSKIIFSKI